MLGIPGYCAPCIKAGAIVVSIACANVAHAVTFNVPEDSSFSLTPSFGVIGAGTHVFSGNINGSCQFARNRLRPNCLTGDVGNTIDSFSFLLADGFKVTRGIFTVSNYSIDGFRPAIFSGNVQISDEPLDNSFVAFSDSESFNFRGDTVLNLSPSIFLNDDNRTLVLLGVTSTVVRRDEIDIFPRFLALAPETFQGVGDISYDYNFSFDVVDTNPLPIALPASLPLLVGGLGLFGWVASRKRRNVV